MQNTLEWVRTNFLSDLLVPSLLFYSIYSYSRGSVATLKYRSAVVKQQCFVWEWIHFLLFLPAFCSSVMKISFPTFRFTYCVAKILLLACLVLLFYLPIFPSSCLFHVKINGHILLFPLFCTFHFLFALPFPWYKMLLLLNENNETSLSCWTV